MESTNSSSSSAIVNGALCYEDLYDNPSTSPPIYDGLPRDSPISLPDERLDPPHASRVRRSRETSIDLDRPAKKVKKVGLYYCRGSATISPEELDRLVKLGDKIDRAICRKREKREKLERACQKLQEDTRDFALEKLATESYTTVKEGLEELGFDISKTYKEEEEGEIYSVKLEFIL